MKELDKIPFSFQTSYTSKCDCCETIKTETIDYELQIKLILTFGFNDKEKRSYLLFYKPRFYSSFAFPPQNIGLSAGLGEEDITILVDELEKELKDKKII